jgi:hypothetical protein
MEKQAEPLWPGKRNRVADGLPAGPDFALYAGAGSATLGSWDRWEGSEQPWSQDAQSDL